MTFDEAVHEIEEAIDDAVDAATASSLGLRVKLQFDAVSYDVFEHFADRYGVADREAQKCACRNCGTIVIAYDAVIDDAVTLLMSRSATNDETVELLEQWAR